MGTVKYLLDTHTLLWALCDETRLGKNARAAMANNSNPLYVSAVSIYEIIYKHQLGKLPQYDYFVQNFFGIMTQLNATELPLSIRHAHCAGRLKWAHRDPFDRLLAAQAKEDDMVLITNDPVFSSLPITVIW